MSLFETRCGLSVECRPCIDAKLSDGEQVDICDAVSSVAGRGDLTEKQAERQLYDEIQLITSELYVSVRVLATAVEAYKTRKHRTI